MSLFAELKRRNVFKVAAAYAIVAWLLIQIATSVFPLLALPEWAAPLVTVFLIIGFPVAIILAWAYELTPQGVKPTHQVPASDSMTHVTSKRLDYVVIALLAFALVFVVVDAYVLDDDSRAPATEATAAPAAGLAPSQPTENRPVSRVSINPSRGESWVISPHDPDFAIAPDGERIAYIARRGNENHVIVRRLNEFEGRSLGSFGGVVRYPFFSRDGQWIGFVDGNALKKVNVRDGTAVTIAILPSFMSGASWGPDNVIVIGTLNRGLYRVPASGGEPEPLPTEAWAVQRSSARWPDFLPDGRALLFASVNSRGEADVRALSLEDGTEKVIVSGATFPRYASSGHLLYVSDSVLWAVAFDPRELTRLSEPVPVVDGVMIKGPRQTGLGSANVDISDTGTLVYRPTGVEGRGTSTLVWVDRQGHEEPMGFGPRVYGRPQLTRDGSKIAVEVTDANLTNTDIWTGDVRGTELSRLTVDAGVDDYPVWTVDGNRLAFRSSRDGGGLFWRAADRSGAAERLSPSEFRLLPWLALPDGSGIVVSGFSEVGTPAAFYTVPLTGGHVPQRLAMPYGPLASISPDGKWLAYSSEDTGNFEVYVQPFPNPDQEKFAITTSGGRDPVWSHDAAELYFQNDTTTYAVAVDTEDGFSAGSPVALFDGPYIDSLGRWYDVAPDGRFVMVKPGWLDVADTPLNVVLNWYAELARAVARD